MRGFHVCLWSYTDSAVTEGYWKTHAEIPSVSALPKKSSRDLRKHGFSFVAT